MSLWDALPGLLIITFKHTNWTRHSRLLDRASSPIQNLQLGALATIGQIFDHEGSVSDLVKHQSIATNQSSVSSKESQDHPGN